MREKISFGLAAMILSISQMPAFAADQYWLNYQQAKVLTGENKNKEAQALLDSTMSDIRKAQPNNKLLAMYLIRYNGTLYNQKKYKDMYPIGKEALGIIEKLPAKDRPEPFLVFQSYAHLGAAYYMNYDFKNAELYLKHASDIQQENRSAVSDTHTRWLYTLLVNTEKALNKPKDAKKYEQMFASSK